MIPVYLAELAYLKESSPEVYEGFAKGNWVVNKNPDVLFCVLAADNALEHACQGYIRTDWHQCTTKG